MNRHPTVARAGSELVLSTAEVEQGQILAPDDVDWTAAARAAQRSLRAAARNEWGSMAAAPSSLAAVASNERDWTAAQPARMKQAGARRRQRVNLVGPLLDEVWGTVTVRQALGLAGKIGVRGWQTGPTGWSAGSLGCRTNSSRRARPLRQKSLRRVAAWELRGAFVTEALRPRSLPHRAPPSRP